MTHYAIAHDLRRCMGCHACEMACKAENNLPDGIFWNKLLTEGGVGPNTCGGTYEAPTRNYVSMQCQHCENPACVEVCPTGATYKDSETGLVLQDYEKCIGCQSCMQACPYEGVRSFIDGEPIYASGVVLGDPEVPAHKENTVEKCTMCAHRIVKGEEPACVATCPAYARTFGDLDDPESEISKLVSSREYKQLLEEAGTNPSVFYLL